MTTSPLESRIQTVDPQMLTPIVLKALRQETGVLTEWTAEQIQIIKGAGGLGPSVIYRFKGKLQTPAESLPWSLILKVLSPALAKPEHGWQSAPDEIVREFRFYQSDLPQQCPPGFRAVDCYHLAEMQNEAGQHEYWLWLEDLSPKSTAPTNEADYYQFAYSLGCFNGRFLRQSSLPSAPWLTQHRVRNYLQRAEPQMERLFAHRDHPFVQRAFPPALVDDYAALWQRREEHLATLDKLPQTLCHNDAQQTNLFLSTNEHGQREVVAIDWAGVGIASLGLDLGQLFWLSLAHFVVSSNLDRGQLSAWEQTIFAGYLAGLQAQGWADDPRLVRLSYTTSLLKQRIGIVLRSVDHWLAKEIPPQLAQHLQANGLTYENFADNHGILSQFFSDLFQESLVLREELL